VFFVSLVRAKQEAAITVTIMMKIETMKKTDKKYYRVDDGCEKVIYEDIDAAMECVKDMLYGISTGYHITIEVVEMTEAKFNGLPEL
jgi:hypothetical protein